MNLLCRYVVLIVAAYFAMVARVDSLFGEDAPKTNRRRFVGMVVDADTQAPLAARVYVKELGEPRPGESWHFVRSAAERGSAWPYSEQWVPMPQSIERHTTISADPFQVDLPPGEYEFELERGKEYLPWRERITIPPMDDVKPTPVIRHTFRLQRWSNAAERGWYSGETHVHRRIGELPNVMQAEELNVTFPVTFWTITGEKAPDLQPSPLRSQGPSPFGPREDRGRDPIWISDRHVIVPRNTEYEIFAVGARQHVLGAIFVLNHRTPFTVTAPPIRPIAAQAHAEGALLDLDKHNWPWSLMLIPIAQVDLYELSNNSVWRTNFGFKQAGQPLPPWAKIEQEAPGTLTEWGWLQYGFELYYALLNCGFRLSPTAGTASGVHPVPLGHSRVYVQTGEKLDLPRWLDGLRRGRSFVTTGPMLFATINRKQSGEVLSTPPESAAEVKWEAEVVSPTPISRVEVLVNGEVVSACEPEARRTSAGAWQWTGTGAIKLTEPGWAVMRTWSNQPDGRKRFAHTGAWYFEFGDKPVRPPRQQIDYLLTQLDASIGNQQNVLAPEAFAEFQQAREIYREIQKRAR